MVAALPYCDALVSGHSFEALARGRRGDRGPLAGRPWFADGVLDSRASALDREPQEPWASATPVAGSSVAMPSGHGPTRGNTTPGWPSETATDDRRSDR